MHDNQFLLVRLFDLYLFGLFRLFHMVLQVVCFWRFHWEPNFITMCIVYMHEHLTHKRVSPEARVIHVVRLISIYGLKCARCLPVKAHARTYIHTKQVKPESARAAQNLPHTLSDFVRPSFDRRVRAAVQRIPGAACYTLNSPAAAKWQPPARNVRQVYARWIIHNRPPEF